MERFSIEPRADWVQKVESVGMYYHTMNDATYWDESAYYTFTSDEVDRLEDATNELHTMCIKAAAHVIRYNLYEQMRIPSAHIPLIKKSWERSEPTMYGRFDFSYDGQGDPKLLEYNADTPTSLLEGSVVQWFWLKDLFPDKDQFNSIHEKLMEFWKRQNFPDLVHFACVKDTEEDLGNVEYVRDIAIQAGYETKHIYVEDIGWNPEKKAFVDLDNANISAIFKLYPWEWLLVDDFNAHLASCGWKVIEPAWKSILSNKGILPLLWELFPNHPNLLPSYYENKFTDNYVRKPFFSREGDSMTIYTDGKIIERPGTYGKEGFVFQQYHPIPEFSGNFTSVGSWVINGKSAGIGIREDSSVITKNTSRFLPHLFY